MSDKNIISYTVEKHQWEDEKKQKRKNRISIVIFGMFVLFLIYILGYQIGKLPQNVQSGDQKLQFIKHIMQDNWYFSKEIPNFSDKLEDQILKGATSFDIDQHTSYLSKEELHLMQSSLQGQFYGIGVTYSIVGESLLVKKVLQNSPAEKAGIKQNDILVEVNQESLQGKTTQEIAEMIRGEKGTAVTIGILRNGEKIEVTPIRDSISTTLEYSVRENVGIVHLNSFSENGGKEMENVLRQLKSQGIRHLVIDLRDNGGGYLKTALDIAGLLLPNNTVVLQQEDVKNKITQNKTFSFNQIDFENVVVVINENSASASEVLAAALREQKGYKIVGVKSFGKGTVQTTHEFKDGSGIKFTVAQWLTPNGNHINKVGITPDFIIENQLVPYNIKVTQPYVYDQVQEGVKYAQILLKTLDYNIQREDGYFDILTKNAVIQFQKNNHLQETGEIDATTMNILRIQSEQKINQNPIQFDQQMKKAIEVVTGG